jgi:hypothetical protein
MREVSNELIKAGIIELIVGEGIPEDDPVEMENEAAKDEVDKGAGRDPQGSSRCDEADSGYPSLPGPCGRRLAGEEE